MCDMADLALARKDSEALAEARREHGDGGSGLEEQVHAALGDGAAADDKNGPTLKVGEQG
jgi:hypothetical protein